jgi:type I restriction enzyme M protein
VVPHGVLFRGSSEGKIRQKTIEDNILEAVIGLPANLFFGTGIPAAILVFNKGKEKNKNVLFIDASQQYENGKNQNKLREADIDKIVDTYRKFSKGALSAGVVEEKYSYVATPEEMSENDYNLNIPRYVDTFEEEAEVDIKAVQRNIEKLEKELKDVQAEMAKYLKELGV